MESDAATYHNAYCPYLLSSGKVDISEPKCYVLSASNAPQSASIPTTKFA